MITVSRYKKKVPNQGKIFAIHLKYLTQEEFNKSIRMVQQKKGQSILAGNVETHVNTKSIRICIANKNFKKPEEIIYIGVFVIF